MKNRKSQSLAFQRFSRFSKALGWFGRPVHQSTSQIYPLQLMKICLAHLIVGHRKVRLVRFAHFFYIGVQIQNSDSVQQYWPGATSSICGKYQGQHKRTRKTRFSTHLINHTDGVPDIGAVNFRYFLKFSIIQV